MSLGRLLELGAAIADPETPLGREARARLSQTTRLSPEGIDLALREHLETSATPGELARLRAWAEPAESCSILLSANVCTAALRAVALGLATSPRVRLRPSRRDPVLAEILVRELGDPEVALTESLEPAAAVHLYGRDETLDALTPAGRVHRFGTGLGLAVCEGETEDLARDVVAFDGAGCLSPRIVIAPKRDALAIAESLHQALLRWGERIPRGALAPSDRAALRRSQATYAAVGAFFEGPHHAIALDPEPRAVALLPPLRAALVVASDEPGVLLAPLLRHVTIVGGEGPVADALATHISATGRIRRAPLGRMQKPPLDGPVDLRSPSVDSRGG